MLVYYRSADNVAPVTGKQTHLPDIGQMVFRTRLSFISGTRTRFESKVLHGARGLDVITRLKPRNQ
jgi:hypothetical protein